MFETISDNAYTVHIKAAMADMRSLGVTSRGV